MYTVWKKGLCYVMVLFLVNTYQTDIHTGLVPDIWRAEGVSPSFSLNWNCSYVTQTLLFFSVLYLNRITALSCSDIFL